jgi:hypothetical protein
MSHTPAVCPGWAGPCPTNEIATWRGANFPARFAQRGGPWRCKACDAKRMGRTILAPSSRTTRCAGWAGSSCDATPPWNVDSPSARGARDGRPWRCRSCNAKREGELRRGDNHWTKRAAKPGGGRALGPGANTPKSQGNVGGADLNEALPAPPVAERRCA